MRRRLTALWHRDLLDRDLAEEMQSHLEMQAEENRESGMDAAAARFAARRQFGNPAALKETSREAWGWTGVESFIQDCRYGARRLVRDRAFAITAIAVLGLAIGANTAAFSVVHAILIRQLPYPAPDRLVFVGESRPGSTSDFPLWPVELADWKAQNRTFQDMTLQHGYHTIDTHHIRLHG